MRRHFSSFPLKCKNRYFETFFNNLTNLENKLSISRHDSRLGPQLLDPGNLLILWVVSHGPRRHFRTATFNFLSSLALADLIRLILCMPVTVIWDVTETWVLGEVMCKVILFVENVTIIVSILTLTFVAWTRWSLLKNPWLPLGPSIGKTNNNCTSMID